MQDNECGGCAALGIPSTSLRTGSSLRLKNGFGQDEAQQGMDAAKTDVAEL
jgi:hypothetical protein